MFVLVWYTSPSLLVVAFSVVPSGFCQIENHLTPATNQSPFLSFCLSVCVVLTLRHFAFAFIPLPLAIVIFANGHVQRRLERTGGDRAVRFAMDGDDGTHYVVWPCVLRTKMLQCNRILLIRDSLDCCSAVGFL